ncbi:GTP-binding protein [Candidatus Uabimicrobium amorphum]|uniref:sulfate adenylyltransferase n=1 Tax=Uabimicrobium amorphum TaxID=2596890 RepID=A0A5S9IM63_UABAM|nr:GTP-binding protein [Candidatus Uabimicrobium amorphum]BBM83600.1 sulfate adenylyltransferase subunit 1 [Candidatus Uabimicrobium amorphum]
MERMNIVVVGHVDHGKSTVVGRLLVDTNSLPEGKLEQVKSTCERNAKPFEYAFLLDALKDEQSQGITIDAARIFFKTDKRYYVIIDAPGHIEFLKNMITGASQAEAALLVIDADEGVQENTRRHGYMLSMLGIEQVVVLINKMDLIDYNEEKYNAIVNEYQEFLTKFGLKVDIFIPVSGREGDNIVSSSVKTPWYEGHSVLEVMDLLQKKPHPVDFPMRMMVQDVYKFAAEGDNRRIVSGTIDLGVLHEGDDVVFFPQGKRGRVKSIETFPKKECREATAGQAVGFTLEEQLYVRRGDLVARVADPEPSCSSLILVSLFWLGRKPLEMQKVYTLKYGTAKTQFHIEKINKVMNASNLQQFENQREVTHNSVAECVLKLRQSLAFDTASFSVKTSRFVIVDDYEICGGGIIRETVKDQYSTIRKQALLRNYKWEKSMISSLRRAEKYNQKSTLILITGPKAVGKKTFAKALEAKLFNDGKFVYFLGIGNVLYGVDADIKQKTDVQQEHFRRLGEIANIMLDAGAILLVTAIEVWQKELEILKLLIGSDKIITVWVGDKITTDINFDIEIEVSAIDQSISKVKDYLQERHIIFRV